MLIVNDGAHTHTTYSTLVSRESREIAQTHSLSSDGWWRTSPFWHSSKPLCICDTTSQLYHFLNFISSGKNVSNMHRTTHRLSHSYPLCVGWWLWRESPMTQRQRAHNNLDERNIPTWPKDWREKSLKFCGWRRKRRKDGDEKTKWFGI